MLIRNACLEDIPQLLELGQNFHHESRYATIPFCDEKVIDLLSHAINNMDQHFFFKVIEHDSSILGGLIGYLTPYYFSEAFSANDLAFFIRPGNRGTIAAAQLIKEFKIWSHQKGATEVCIGVSSGIATDKTGKFLEALQFECIGGIYKQYF
jgi:hypothetical protein